MTARRPRDTYEFLEHAHELGAAGIQAALSSLEPAYVKKLRARAEQLSMYIEIMAALPKQNDGGEFERTVAASKEAGALAVRTAALGGRRYETFASLQAWREFVTDSMARIDRALPVMEKHNLPLALENHKDWTTDEMVSLLKQRSSEHLGVCLDTGNNISLLDDAMSTVEALAPFARSTHIKDMGIRPYEDGFLLSEMPLGEGMLDMRRIVETIRRASPHTRMTLEMITRNPLRVPCLTDRYWATFPHRSGLYLARTLRLAAEQTKRLALPTVDHLPKEALYRLEEDNVKQCLHYARERLDLA